jgi:hypothetical protein
MPIPGGFGTAPTVAVLALSSPSPGVQITVSAMDAGANTVVVYRTDSAGKTIVRGAANSLVAGPFTCDDFEAPIGELLSYTAVTFTVGQVQSDESPAALLTLVSTSTWLSDPLVPTTAVSVTVGEFPDRTRDIDASILRPIGSDAGIIVAGVRGKGSGVLTLVTLALDRLNALRAVLTSTPIILLRSPYVSWDIGTQFLGVQGIVERRIGPMAEPARYVALDVSYVKRPAPAIGGPLHTWDELKSKGYTWNALAAADLTWLQLAQRGGL